MVITAFNGAKKRLPDDPFYYTWWRTTFACKMIFTGNFAVALFLCNFAFHFKDSYS